MNTQSLEYDDVYHCHCSISVVCGRKIRLKSLKQEMTYAEVLMGVPNSRVNDRNLQGAVDRVQNPWGRPGHAPFLIAPERRDYLRVLGDMAALRRDHWIPEWMPVITCVGEFESSRISDKKMDASALTIIWLQDDYAMPISIAALDSIKCIDWASHAFDFAY
jgi:hypothetical protein